AYPDYLFFAPPISGDVPILITPPGHSISTRTSSPSTRSGNTSTRSFAGYSDNPVFTWNAHECHGHTTVSPSSHPCPSGPCRCGHTLSNADNSPFTFARQTATPSTSASATCPTAGASANPHNLTHFAKANSPSFYVRASSHLQCLTAANLQMLLSTKKPRCHAPPPSQPDQPHLDPLRQPSALPGSLQQYP